MNLSPQQLDLLKELINIGVGKAAGLINQMVSTHVSLDLPEILVLSPAECEGRLGHGYDQTLSTVRLGFRGPFSGWAGLVFPKQSASWLVSQMLGQDLDGYPMDLDSLRIGTIQEVGNIVLNGVMGSIVNVLGVGVDYFPPDYFESNIADLFKDGGESPQVIILIKARFSLEGTVAEGDILIFFHMATFENLLAALDRLLNPHT